MSEGKTAAACEKFAASQRADASSGTLLNLADCHAKEGKSASAWAEFLAAGRMARTQGDTVRSAEAARRAKELEPILSHVTIKLALRAPGIQLQRDDFTLQDAELFAPIPVDPGPHVFRAEAPGYKPWSKSIHVGANADNQEVVVPALEKDTSSVAPSRPTTPSSVDATSNADVSHRSPNFGYVLGAAGVVVAGVGGVLGLKALKTYKDAEADCHGQHTQCPASSSSQYDTASLEANLANAGIGVGLVAIGIGAYLVLTSGGSGASKASALPSPPLAIAPWAEMQPTGKPGSTVGALATGRF